MNENNLRTERLVLLIGTVTGQISQVLNYLKSEEAQLGNCYAFLLDIHQMAALQIHEIYYKGNKPEEKE